MAPREIKHRFVYSLSDVLAHYRAGAEKGEFTGEQHRRLQRGYNGENCWVDGGRRMFYGVKQEQMLRWIAEGYDPPDSAFRGLPVELEGEGIAWSFNDDDGDYEHDLFISGEPDYYLDRRTVPSKPGITVQVGLDFNCAVKPEVVAAYGEWVASALRAIQQAGFDVQLTVTNTCENQTYEVSGITQTTIVVKRFGEVLIPQDFLILFSPGGFRHLFFMAICMPEAEGYTVQGGLGTPLHSHEWGVDYDEDQRVLQITSNAQHYGTDFPKDELDEMFREVSDRF